MALQIRGINYVIPGENGSPGPTGREIIEIESAFVAIRRTNSRSA